MKKWCKMKRRLRNANIALVVIILLINSFGCTKQSDSERTMSDSTRAGSFDAFVTWTNYDGIEDPRLAVYVWNGKEIGVGQAGFNALAGRLGALPNNSLILVYPKYPYSDDVERAKAPRAYPWQVDQANLDKFNSIVSNREHRIVYSGFDLNGNILRPRR